MSVIEKFMTKFFSVVSEPRLTSFSKFKYHKQDQSQLLLRAVDKF